MYLKETIPGSGEEESWWSQQGSIHSSKGWTSNKNWNDPGHGTIQPVCKGDSDCLWAQDLCGWQSGVEGYDCEDVYDKADDAGDSDGSWKISNWILNSRNK